MQMMHTSGLPAHSFVFFLLYFHLPRPPNRKCKAQPTKRCTQQPPLHPGPTLKQPLTGSRHRLVVAKRTVSVSAHWTLCGPECWPPCWPGLCRPLSILIHLYAITPHPSLLSCAASRFFFLFVCFFSTLTPPSPQSHFPPPTPPKLITA